MSDKTYPYLIADFPNETVDTTLLAQEIQASSITTSLVSVTTQGNDCLTTFSDTLTTVEYGVFDNILHIHQGTQTTYAYSISGDFPTGAVDPDQLWEEILASSISSVVVRVTTSGDDCNTIFKTPLSAPDKTILDGLVAAHVPVQRVYAYSISADFPNQKVDLGALDVQIVESAITTTLVGVNTKGDICNIVFEDQLSAPDKTILDGLVAIHTGNPTMFAEDAYAEDEAKSTTTSTLYVEKLRLTIRAAETTKYLLRWSFEVYARSGKYPFYYRVRLDDTTNILEMKDVSNVDGYWKQIASFIELDLTQGSHFITIDYSATDVLYPVGIRQAKLATKRA